MNDDDHLCRKEERVRIVDSVSVKLIHNVEGGGRGSDFIFNLVL